MPRTLQDIRTALEVLAERWKDFQGTEKAASQTFLNELVSAYTGASDAMAAGARFEEFGGRDDGSGFMGLYWPGVAIVEMKAPSQTLRLDQHRPQIPGDSDQVRHAFQDPRLLPPDHSPANSVVSVRLTGNSSTP